MDIHKPKPFHNLREFASEVVIIVVGVAIALAGEQAIEWWSWERRAEQARQAIAVELGDDVGTAEGRAKMVPCIAARLDTLARIVDTAAASGRLPPVAPFERPISATWDSDTWHSVQASQAAAHLSRNEQIALAEAYQLVASLDATTKDEHTAWSRLATLYGPGRAFPADEASAMRAALVEAGEDNEALIGNGVRLKRHLRAENIGFNTQIERQVADFPVWVCGRAGPIPPNYGGDRAARLARFAAQHASDANMRFRTEGGDR